MQNTSNDFIENNQNLQVLLEAHRIISRRYLGFLPKIELSDFLRQLISLYEDHYLTFHPSGNVTMNLFDIAGLKVNNWTSNSFKVAGFKNQRARVLKEEDIIIQVNDSPIIEAYNNLEFALHGFTFIALRGINTKEVSIVHDFYSPVSIDQNMKSSLKIIIYEDTITVAISDFYNSTINELLQKLPSIQDSKIILDLRGNMGGPVANAVRLLEVFTPLNMVLYVYRDKTNKKERRSCFEYPKISPPFAILVDGNTMSSAELVAASLHDNFSVPLVGTKTYGKGKMLRNFKLSSGGLLRVPTYEFYSPSGMLIEGNGLQPEYGDIEVLRDAVNNCG